MCSMCKNSWVFGLFPKSVHGAWEIPGTQVCNFGAVPDKKNVFSLSTHNVIRYSNSKKSEKRVILRCRDQIFCKGKNQLT